MIKYPTSAARCGRRHGPGLAGRGSERSLGPASQSPANLHPRAASPSRSRACTVEAGPIAESSGNRPPLPRRTHEGAAPDHLRRSSLLFFLLALVLTGCGRSVGPSEPEYLEVLEVTVGPTLAKCYGVGPRSCMVVNGGLFYDGIEGFEYEAGFDYRLRIGKYDPWGGSEPPQDASRYAYRLLEQLEKTPAPSTPAVVSVAPARVVCARSDDFCMVVDGTPYDDIITSFEYEVGHHYVLETEKYRDGRYVTEWSRLENPGGGHGRGDHRRSLQGRVRRRLPGILQDPERRPLPWRDRGLRAPARIRLPLARREVCHVPRRGDRVTRCAGLRLSLAGDARGG